MNGKGNAIWMLVLNTVAFTICFAAWMLNGVLVTFLVDKQIFSWDATQIGILIGTPVLTGSLIRLPLGMLTDRFGGKPIFAAVMLISAIPMYLLSQAQTFQDFFWCSLGFGLSGGSFAVGIAFTSVWFSKERQGTALGIFGAGNAGSALTTLIAPTLLNNFTQNGENLDAWRQLPMLYAAILAGMAIIFFVGAKNKLAEGATQKSFFDLLAPLKHVRVWRFGFYYFLVFGGFVALAQWLVPYYVNVYSMSIVTAGLLTSIFAFPSGVIRALGGVLSDSFGARRVMYWILSLTALSCLLLFFPKMDIESPGRGVMALRGGTVTAVSANAVTVGDKTYKVAPKPTNGKLTHADDALLLLPQLRSWQEPVIKVGDEVKKKQLLARGVTHIYFQANVWVFTFFVFVIGITMGIGKAAVYKYIPDYFPNDVGVVGGIVGVLGGLGGFFCPILFGYLLDNTGLWTMTWVFLFAVSIACLVWLHVTVKHISKVI